MADASVKQDVLSESEPKLASPLLDVTGESPSAVSNAPSSYLKPLANSDARSRSRSTSPSRIPRIQVAPLNVPFERRQQTGAVIVWLLGLPVTLFVFVYMCTMPLFWPMILAYGLFLLFDDAPENGGRRVDFARKAPFWKWYADFFPIKLVKTADLDPSKNYLFGYHPHGVIAVGAWTNFGTEANNFSGLFPGITCRLLTLASNFNIPLYRDYLMAQGCASVSRTSCENILGKGPGHSIMIVVGGASESLNAFPGVYDLTLKKRLGFVKLAIRTGSWLVPVLSFGENDIWEQVRNEEGGVLNMFQRQLKALVGWTLPLIHGRGVFNYNVGILPHRRPIVTVVGKPIEVIKKDDATDEEVRAIQEKYIQGLFDIWETYKDAYAKNRVSDLKLVD